MWGYSSVLEHLTADQEVLSSNLGAPFGLGRFGVTKDLFFFKGKMLLFDIIKNLDLISRMQFRAAGCVGV